MSRPDPVAALDGTRTGHICDSCNRGVRTGDLVRVYATYYDGEGWVCRWLWCSECGSDRIESGTPDADEVVAEAVFWNRRLVSIELRDRSTPTD